MHSVIDILQLHAVFTPLEVISTRNLKLKDQPRKTIAMKIQEVAMRSATIKNGHIIIPSGMVTLEHYTDSVNMNKHYTDNMNVNRVQFRETNSEDDIEQPMRY